jgi:hypothetical protein
MSEASSADYLKVRPFPLSLSGISFFMVFCSTIWFYSYMDTFRAKFQNHFYSGENELKLSHLTSVKQQHDESVVDYIKRFRDTKN